MTEEQIVNQLYWGPSFADGYTYGSRIKVAKNGRINLSNPLLAFGRSLIAWTTDMNWQRDKMISQLPLLRVGEQYRIVTYAHSEPANTFITRLTFFDQQGGTIKQLNLEGTENEFTFPFGTVNYQLELISAGCIKIDFQRIEIGPAALPLAANDDLWLQPPLTEPTADKPDQVINLLVTGASKRMKHTYHYLHPLAGRLAVQMLLVAWQYQDDLAPALTDLLAANQINRIHLVSCDPQFDAAVLDVCQGRTNYQALVTNKTAVAGRAVNAYQYAWQAPTQALKPTVAERDWARLFQTIKQIWGGDVDATRSN